MVSENKAFRSLLLSSLVADRERGSEREDENGASFTNFLISIISSVSLTDLHKHLPSHDYVEVTLLSGRLSPS